jgi:hypothetical protein
MGGGSVYLPYALERKYKGAGRSWLWQYVFAARTLSKDPRSGAVRRHHQCNPRYPRFSDWQENSVLESAKICGCSLSGEEGMLAESWRPHHRQDVRVTFLPWRPLREQRRWEEN